MIIVFTIVITIQWARRLKATRLGYLVVLVTLAGNFFELFQNTHDTWLLLFVLELIWLGILGISSPPDSAWVALAWGVFGGVAALCSPVVGFVWASVTLYFWFLRQWWLLVRIVLSVAFSFSVEIPLRRHTVVVLGETEQAEIRGGASCFQETAESCASFNGTDTCYVQFGACTFVQGQPSTYACDNGSGTEIVRQGNYVIATSGHATGFKESFAEDYYCYSELPSRHNTSKIGRFSQLLLSPSTVGNH